MLDQYYEQTKSKWVLNLTILVFLSSQRVSNESFLWRMTTSFYCTNSIFIPTCSKIKFNSPVIRMDFSKLPIRRLSTTLNAFKNDRRNWKPYYNNRHGWQRCKFSKIMIDRHFRWISSFNRHFRCIEFRIGFCDVILSIWKISILLCSRTWSQTDSRCPNGIAWSRSRLENSK